MWIYLSLRITVDPEGAQESASRPWPIEHLIPPKHSDLGDRLPASDSSATELYPSLVAVDGKVMVRLAADGAVSLNGQLMDSSQTSGLIKLHETLSQLIAEADVVALELNADDEASGRLFVEVLNVFTNLGLKDVTLGGFPDRNDQEESQDGRDHNQAGNRVARLKIQISQNGELTHLKTGNTVPGAISDQDVLVNFVRQACADLDQTRILLHLNCSDKAKVRRMREVAQAGFEAGITGLIFSAYGDPEPEP